MSLRARAMAIKKPSELHEAAPITRFGAMLTCLSKEREEKRKIKEKERGREGVRGKERKNKMHTQKA